jgi:hypothetical protein
MLGGILGTRRPVYESADLGRLFSPCTCKGSQKYVHEQCLQQWRSTDPSSKNFFQCPTCLFKYRIERISAARFLTSVWTQMALTILILITLAFLLGFLGDTIIGLWADPAGSLYDMVGSAFGAEVDDALPPANEPWSLVMHFIKGFAAIGLLGFLKVASLLSPIQLWNLRSATHVVGGGGGGGRRRRGGTGRDRVENISLAVVIIGIITSAVATWNLVQKISARALQKVGDTVIDVGGDDDDVEEEEPVMAQEGKKDV